jgi:hypothetical protein
LFRSNLLKNMVCHRCFLGAFLGRLRECDHASIAMRMPVFGKILGKAFLSKNGHYLIEIRPGNTFIL